MFLAAAISSATVMSYCLNPDCKQPVNASAAKRCAHCGEPLEPRLRDRYRILRNIGQGGFGKTFLAIDEDRLNARCVIKQFSPQVKGTQGRENAVRLFEQEALRLYELGEHPSIPALLAYFEHRQRLYLVQQFVEGETLLQELGQQGVFSEHKIREVLVGILPVLKFIHDRNVIHRDITPANIVRRHLNHKLVLIDFGVAKLLNATTFGLAGTKIGTEGYAPIEQLRNGKAYPASDLYSLGVTCIYLLTQTRPDQLYDPQCGRWLWREILAERGAGLSPGIGQILDHMVKDLLAERYQSAEEVIRDLRLALTYSPGDGSAAAPVPQGLTSSPSVGRSSSPAPGFPYSAVAVSQVGRPAPSPSRPVTSASSSSGHPPLRLSQGVFSQHIPLWHILLGHSSWVMAAAASHDGQLLVSGGLDDRILLWHVPSGQCLRVLQGHTKPINSVVFTPDDQILVSGSDDDTIKLWSVSTGQLLRSLSGHTQDVNAVAVSPDGRFIVSGSEDRTVRVWRCPTGEPLRHFDNVTTMVRASVISSQGDWVASGGFDGQIKVWQLNAGQLVHTFSGHLSTVMALAISPDQRLLVSGSKDRTIRIWNLQTGEPLQVLLKHLDTVNAVAITPDGTLLISASADKTVRIWRLASGELLATLTGHTGAVNALAISPDQTWFASAGCDGRIQVWQLPGSRYA